MKARDKRTGLMNEILQGVRMLKCVLLLVFTAPLAELWLMRQVHGVGKVIPEEGQRYPERRATLASPELPDRSGLQHPVGDHTGSRHRGRVLGACRPSSPPRLVADTRVQHYTLVAGKSLTPSIAFTSIAVFDELRFALANLPETFIQALQGEI